MYIMGMEEGQVSLAVLLILYTSITKQALQHFFYSIDCLEIHLFHRKAHNVISAFPTTLATICLPGGTQGTVSGL